MSSICIFAVNQDIQKDVDFEIDEGVSKYTAAHWIDAYGVYWWFNSLYKKKGGCFGLYDDHNLKLTKEDVYEFKKIVDADIAKLNTLALISVGSYSSTKFDMPKTLRTAEDGISAMLEALDEGHTLVCSGN